MNPTEIKDYITIGLTCILIIMYLITFLLRKSSNKKAAKLADKVEESASRILAIKKLAENYMALAEQFLEFSGEDKKQWVTSHIKEECIQNGITYDDDEISKSIEELINFSKKVNPSDNHRIEQANEEEQANE